MPWWWDLPFIIHPCLEQHNSVSVCVHDVVLHICIGDFFFFWTYLHLASHSPTGKPQL